MGTWPAQGEEEGGELRGHQINLNGTGPSPHCEVEASTWPLEVEGGSVGDTPYIQLSTGKVICLKQKSSERKKKFPTILSRCAKRWREGLCRNLWALMPRALGASARGGGRGPAPSRITVVFKGCSWSQLQTDFSEHVRGIHVFLLRIIITGTQKS